ncbi:hypothetical protein DOY81_008898 [Sarcophaga bullata]|nr:hypothetical protein DOY81_008898 [Sarcophaga bullata]
MDDERDFMDETPHKSEIDPCENNKCRRGSRCVANLSARDGYQCKCKHGQKGRYCEQGEGTSTEPPTNTVTSSCRKEQVREYYTENDCRSRQPLKYAKCVGGCGNQCCAAKIVRRRKVRMVCSNNRKYIKNLDVVRNSLDTNLEQRNGNFTILSNNSSNNVNTISNSSNYNLGNSIKITEELFYLYGKNMSMGTLTENPDEKEEDKKAGFNDYESEYETEDNDDSDDMEQMQLNPNRDYYDDEDIKVDYDKDDLYSNIYDNESSEPEILPEAKELVQLSVTDRSLTVDKGGDDEEEDMGYDEDDERIAIAIERPKEMRSRVKMNLDSISREGSGSYEKKPSKGSHRLYSANNRHQFDYTNSFDKKQQKSLMDHTNSDVTVDSTEVELRESSGNFANDDEDNDDDNDDDDDSNRFFNIKRKSNSRYFRKNTNDAIKIISTPLGKVGIVYQQTSVQPNDKTSETVEKKAISFTDFDALSPDPESSHRLASSHPKITPVLTPDGKVALLYRGDSENSKYEPFRNLTSPKFNNGPERVSDRKSSSDSNNKDTSNSSEYDDSDSSDLEDNSSQKTLSYLDSKSNSDTKITTEKEQAAILSAPDAAPTTGSFIIRPTDSVLPMINRPLSEVLGIKKNQFKQFRIKDTPTTTESSSMSEFNSNSNSETKNFHFLTKVNLADYSTSLRSRNYDFDFSRDNTMLDERSRNKDQQINSHNADGNQQIDGTNEPMNEDILSKTEVVNLAIIPHFDEELERLQRLREYEERRHHRQRQKQNEEDLSGIHCIMQAMMGIAAISTVFGIISLMSNFKHFFTNQISYHFKQYIHHFYYFRAIQFIKPFHNFTYNLPNKLYLTHIYIKYIISYLQI